MVLYGQVLVGAPGSGKTTYCNGMQQYLRLIGRETLVVNLDPANEFLPTTEHEVENDESQNPTESHLPYDVILDVSEEIINLSSVMVNLSLGPNGGLIYCLEYIQHHIATLVQILTKRIDDYCKVNSNAPPPYLLFDLPGQVELYTHNTCVQSILKCLVSELDLRLAAVHLVDAHSCTDASKFISAALLSTTTMLRLELPAVNVLSKIDLLRSYGEDSIPFNLDFFLDCQELDRLLPYLEGNGPLQSSFSNIEEEGEEVRNLLDEDEDYKRARYNTQNTRFYKRYSKLNRELCEVIDDYSLLSYVPLDINDAVSVGRLIARIDKCNGYVFTGRNRKANTNKDGSSTGTSTDSRDVDKTNMEDMFRCAMQIDGEWRYEQIADIQERYMG
mmetsp:Transcript_17365/g.32924  ORF Transcript_17365/g.32924 Transcript_17365/m.32924 type:complete len:388 (+) Transcript_17365:161-1324(+)